MRLSGIGQRRYIYSFIRTMGIRTPRDTIMHLSKVILSSLVLAAMGLAHAGQDVTPAEIERLHKEIRPRAGESPWAEIHWMYDLHKARQKAAKEGKPLCVWRMAGDPTGAC
jgi:hypothetical protein